MISRRPAAARWCWASAAFSDQGVDFTPLGGPFITNFQNVTARSTREARRTAASAASTSSYFAPNFNNGTEFGLYFLNYHSRLPLISGQHRHTGGRRQRRSAR